MERFGDDEILAVPGDVVVAEDLRALGEDVECALADFVAGVGEGEIDRVIAGDNRDGVVERFAEAAIVVEHRIGRVVDRHRGERGAAAGDTCPSSR